MSEQPSSEQDARERVVSRVREGLGPKARSLHVHSPSRVYVDVEPADLLDAADVLFNKLRARYAIASGLQVADGFEVLHHFIFDAEGVIVSLRVQSHSQEPEFESLALMIKGAEFIEREMRDLLGIRFRNHPNPTRLILSDDWPDGVYPLRRGRPWEGKVKKEV